MHVHHEQVNQEVERFNPPVDSGLTSEQVEQRIKENQVNISHVTVGKSVWEILRSNVFTLFNTMLFIIAAFMIYANVADGDPRTKWYTGTFFMLILLSNIIIGLYQDIKTKRLMLKMSVLNRGTIEVIRDGEVKEIDTSEIVLDDICRLKSGDQVAVDSVVLEGYLLVDESCVTGESRSVPKNEGDFLYSGSIVSSGKCIMRAERVGKNNSMEALSIKARSVKRNPSHILKSLKILFRVLGIVILFAATAIITTYAIHGGLSTEKDFINAIRPFAGQFVAMIPAGLYLLTSVALVSGILSLYKKGAYVQELYSIEMLARSDVLCVDKTGTITSGNMHVKAVDVFDKTGRINENEIGHIVANIIAATGDENVTAQALKDKFGGPDGSLVPIKSLAFNSENKYSGASFTTGITYVLGALEKLNFDPIQRDELEKMVSIWASKGYRVMVVAKGTEEISGDCYLEQVYPLALIILEEQIKEDAVKTFEWFKNNDVEIKVISGDNLMTVSSIAQSVGIPNANKCISLENMSIEEVKQIANEYTVFCRVSPEQKEAIVMSLKENGRTVAMTGDGVNDILALKHADCSIAMNSGSQSAKNISHIVLRNNNFSAMPDIVAEGRRVINNLTRTGSLFLTKTFFAITLSLVFWIVSVATQNQYSYPFSTNNMLVWEVFGIGLSAFFIALEPNSAPIKRGFLRRILKRAIPGALLIVTAVFISYLAYIVQDRGIMYTGVSSFGYITMESSLMRYGATAIAVISFSLLSFVVLFIVCRPLSKYRAIVLSSAIAITVIMFLLIGFLSPENNIFGINFNSLTYENLLLIGVIVISLASIMIFIQTIIYNVRKEMKKK